MTAIINEQNTSTAVTDFDAIVIGAGFAGLYALHNLRDQLGLSVRVYEVAVVDVRGNGRPRGQIAAHRAAGREQQHAPDPHTPKWPPDRSPVVAGGGNPVRAGLREALLGIVPTQRSPRTRRSIGVPGRKVRPRGPRIRGGPHSPTVSTQFKPPSSNTRSDEAG